VAVEDEEALAQVRARMVKRRSNQIDAGTVEFKFSVPGDDVRSELEHILLEFSRVEFVLGERVAKPDGRHLLRLVSVSADFFRPLRHLRILGRDPQHDLSGSLVLYRRGILAGILGAIPPVFGVIYEIPHNKEAVQCSGKSPYRDATRPRASWHVNIPEKFVLTII
jgi:hypothetical protein